MKKNLILVLLLLVAACSVFALPITTADANRVARNLITEKLGSNYTVSDTKALDSGYPTTYIYVINLKPSGFVLVAADDAATPIIGYSTVNNWGDGDVPSQLQYMLVIWNDQMHAIVTQRMAATSNITREWSKYNVSASNFTPDRNFRDVSPLLSTVWGQGTYYNDLCPTGTPVGCVATAMAQIMRYWSFPTVGTGTHTYTYGGITHNVDFGATTYNWAAMPNYINSANTSVATIGYHAGVSVNMQYDPSGSGAYSNEVPEAMINHFRYASTTVYSNRNPNATVWNNLLKGELDNARPVYYSGYSPGSGGHAWVLDGYSGSDYHVNWGWNGTYNGWYSIDALNPAGENFSSSQGAVTGIYPTASTPALTEGFELATFPPTGWTVTASTFARSTTGFISGTNSARYNPTATAANCSGKQLRTPKLTVNASSAPITFKAKRGTLNRTEQIKVGYSASATGPYTYLTTFTLTASSAIYTQAVTAITPGDYYFVLETLSTTSTSNAKLWVIDDVTGPNFPTAAATNLSSWTAGNLFPGDQASSGNVFTLSNTGGGTLTVTSVTNLGASEFKSNFNTAINLVYGQTHDFGFTYDPLNYGADAINYEIGR
ncbi:MAG: C10 family peptidase, partial [Candidatus Cloacimonas sp.]|nr:C10 family peptidase [Candidatus Cloacimonas sp.]